ncbi:LexA family transcriptional regulator [Gelria sp. Kuro-4]|uniref:LexA family protein n=1 Tax=Gelria sp. Kuro-4 TaxID=2796927 RepID=UPI001BF05284|nr:S24 family peptidase [Gelria sp. Kuro-4]BCV26009.1 hypothetical protein kuro4_27820 [Gelria sp. Kuro-4]
MSTLGQRIHLLRQKEGLTQEELAKRLNVARGTLANWEIGRTNLDPEMLKRLADLFEVSTDYLLCRTSDPHGTYLPPGAMTARSMVRVPVLSSIRAGVPVDTCEQIEGYKTVPVTELGGAEYFFFRVGTDSMTRARIYPDDLVLVRQQDFVNDGEIAVVAVDRENATVKRVYFQDDTIILQSETDNLAHRPILFQGEDKKTLHIFGRVVKVTFEPK